MLRPFIAATALSLFFLSPAALADANVAVQFLGWSPDGARYAVARHTTTFDEAGSPVTASVVQLHSVDDALNEQALPLPDGQDPFEFATREGFVVEPLTRRPLGGLAWSFIDDNGLDLLRFSVLVAEGLSWEVATRSTKGKRVTLAAAPIEALYVDFEPDVFLAPRGDKALLVVGMRAPFRYTAIVRVLGLSEPALRVAEVLPGWDRKHPAPDGPDAPAEPPPLLPGDVVIDWTQTEAVEPIIEPDPLLEKLAAPVGDADATSRAAVPVEAPAAAEEPVVEPVAEPIVEPAEDPLAEPPVDVGPEPLPATFNDLAPVDESETVDTAPPEPPPTVAAETTADAGPQAPKPPAEPPPAVDLAGTVRLVGFVRTDDVYKGSPIKGATVTVTPGGTTTTNANGLYQVRVPLGTVTVSVQAKGYETLSEDKVLEPDVENWKTVVLVRPGEKRPPPPATPAAAP